MLGFVTSTRRAGRLRTGVSQTLIRIWRIPGFSPPGTRRSARHPHATVTYVTGKSMDTTLLSRVSIPGRHESDLRGRPETVGLFARATEFSKRCEVLRTMPMTTTQPTWALDLIPTATS